MNEPFFSFGTRERDECPVEIRVLRPVLLLRHTEQLPRHADPGELATVPAWVLDALPLDSYEVTGTPAPGIVDHRDS